MTRETVQWCTVCGCKTWFLDGVCEWSDGPISPANCIASDRSSSALDHRLQQARREIEPEIEHTVAWFYEGRPARTWAQCYVAGISADLEKKPRVPPADYTEYEQACWFAGYDR